MQADAPDRVPDMPIGRSNFTPQQIQQLVSSVPIWFHSIEVGYGIVTPGAKSASLLAQEIASLQLPDLRGKTVLDVGAFDGFYSFEAERLGAASVTALDHYMWSIDLVEHHRHWQECVERGLVPEPYHSMPYWRPNELPGKRGFDVASRLLASKVRGVLGDFATMDLQPIGTFDVVLFLGVLYHLESPMEALRRLASITGRVAVIETEAVFVPPFESRAMFEFFGSNELNNDVSNWWAPNIRALESMCLAAGFRRVVTIQGEPAYLRRLASRVGRLVKPRVRRYRAVVQAWRWPLDPKATRSVQISTYDTPPFQACSAGLDIDDQPGWVG